ncbi:MAG: hypothetical protein IT551_01800 [Novosphingobium sp.]|jgi:hypothetical protein|nr:hypothetical protein [Novosphingobium sp.]
MAGLIGTLVGATLGIYLLASLWEWLLFKRILDDPLKGKVLSVVTAYISGSFIAGFGMADGGQYFWGAFLLYLVPAIIVGALSVRRGKALRVQVTDTEIQNTFS